MKFFKILSLYVALNFYNFINADNDHERLKQKIDFLENVIADIMQNGSPLVTTPHYNNSCLYDEQDDNDEEDDDHRMTLRIPKWLIKKIDEKRKQRVGKISRNLWILEVIVKAVKK